ncbi:SPRY domain-containing SOCS box protein 3-like isoform X2 [Coregonus clupeaformis]|uniref:SPRY domain-containing SOCS box protein 3-like isoform X2 n=1 Tax=Coregonus clupeaformis TaxID=59861 RepID=UPI001BDFD9B0|nr:SPRY domain-containing SOCS box protein 3-like isoform X2 [Coregonus clupeaformis]
MLRRSRNSQAQHYVWSDIQRDIDTMAVVLVNDREEWGDEHTQISDSDSEVDYLAIIPEVTDVVPDTVPVTGESYCHCDPWEETSPGALLQGFQTLNDCLCGEEDQGFDWVWDEGVKPNAAFLSCDNRKVSFHSEYSCGTAAIRGTKELADGQHFWEIKMTSPVYGTDMMVGIGTAEVNLDKFQHSFCSMLGMDEDSWGLSYTGILQHKGDKVNFSSRFGQGSIIGLHFDTWHGTLTFYKNRRCIGVATTRLQNKKFYPMVCSTAAKSSMKVIRACYTPTSLQYLCCSRLRQQRPNCPDILNLLPLPPGLRHLLHIQLGWVFTLNNGAPEQSEDLTEDFVDDFAVELPDDLLEEPSPCPSPCLSQLSSLSPCSSPSPVPNPLPCQCPCLLSPSAQPCPSLCPCLPTLPGSNSYSEDFQWKRCRWT